MQASTLYVVHNVCTLSYLRGAKTEATGNYSRYNFGTASFLFCSQKNSNLYVSTEKQWQSVAWQRRHWSPTNPSHTRFEKSKKVGFDLIFQGVKPFEGIHDHEGVAFMSIKFWLLILISLFCGKNKPLGNVYYSGVWSADKWRGGYRGVAKRWKTDNTLAQKSLAWELGHFRRTFKIAGQWCSATCHTDRPVDQMLRPLTAPSSVGNSTPEVGGGNHKATNHY